MFEILATQNIYQFCTPTLKDPKLHRNDPQTSPILWWSPKNIHKIFIPQKNIHFSENPPKKLNSEFWTQKNSPSLRICENIRVPPWAFPLLRLFYFRFLSPHQQWPLYPGWLINFRVWQTVWYITSKIVLWSPRHIQLSLETQGGGGGYSYVSLVRKAGPSIYRSHQKYRVSSTQKKYLKF